MAIVITHSYRLVILKYHHCVGKLHTVLSQVGAALVLIPFESQQSAVYAQRMHTSTKNGKVPIGGVVLLIERAIFISLAK